MADKGLGEHGAQPLGVRSEDFGEWGCHLHVSGELDMHSGPLVRQAVEDAVRRGRNQVSVVAAEVTFIDSSALMLLLNARDELIKVGGTLRVTDPSRPVARILEIAMLNDLLIHNTGDEL
jgi:anti-anti-sigma factor